MQVTPDPSTPWLAPPHIAPHGSVRSTPSYPSVHSFPKTDFPASGETYDVLGRRVFVPSSPAPPPARWARLFPGGYDPKLQIPLMGKKMMIAIEAIGGLAILFYGYDQGVMSGVMNNPDFKTLMGVDVTHRPLGIAQPSAGSLPSITPVLVGGLVGGYLGDSIGRVNDLRVYDRDDRGVSPGERGEHHLNVSCEGDLGFRNGASERDHPGVEQ